MADEFITPIMNRNENDINYLKMLLEMGWDNFTDKMKEDWLSLDFRGALNASDLNRIENNLNVISKIRNITITSKTNWSNSDIFDVKNYQRIINNLTQIVSGLNLDDNTPAIPNYNENITYIKLNDIEKIIYNVYNLITEEN